MPWNDESGGDRRPGPWGEPSKGGPPAGPRPGHEPDLEEITRRLQERFRGVLGGGRGGKGGKGGPGFAALGAVMAFAWLASGVFVVDEGEQGVVSRFGAFDRVALPGLHVHLPWPVEGHQVVPVTVQRLVQVGFRGGDGVSDRPDESLMLTGDESIIDVDFTVQWSVNDVKQFVFNVRDQEELIFAVAESAMREVVGQRQLQAIITTDRSAVEEDVRKLMQAMLEAYRSGVMVNQVQLQKAEAPPPVIEAFNDVVKASQDGETKINEATRYRNEQVPQARGEAARMIQQAEAYKERVVREANGEAERFRLIEQQYRAAPRVTRDRLYLETMERVYGGADKMIVDGKSGALPYLPLDRFKKSQAPATAQGDRQ